MKLTGVAVDVPVSEQSVAVGRASVAILPDLALWVPALLPQPTPDVTVGSVQHPTLWPHPLARHIVSRRTHSLSRFPQYRPCCSKGWHSVWVALPHRYEGEPDAVRIVVERLAADKAGSPLLQAILCSVGSPLESEEGFTALPVLLVKGQATIGRQVVAWLQAEFDCRVAPLLFPPYAPLTPYSLSSWPTARGLHNTAHCCPLSCPVPQTHSDFDHDLPPPLCRPVKLATLIPLSESRLNVSPVARTTPIPPPPLLP